MTINKKLLKLVVFAMFLLSCSFGSSYPEEAMLNVKDRAIRTLRTDKLGNSVTGLSGKVIKLKVVDVTLSDNSEERRAFLVFSDNNYRYLGKLQKLAFDIPLEALMFTLNGRRFMIFWVDKTVTQKPTFVTVARPEQLASDDSMRVLSKGEAANRVAVIYIPADQALLWQELTYMRVTGSGGLNDVWEKTFEPPLWIGSDFIEVTLP